ncbi:MAG TPA: hypothetical protein VFA89_07365 [Terriglobales bacterium]|nr:hypothetical protein [Terriglobales bacterium]
MSPLQQFDEQMESLIRELTTRIVVPRLSEFDEVWEAANRVCDHYDLDRRAA